LESLSPGRRDRPARPAGSGRGPRIRRSQSDQRIPGRCGCRAGSRSGGGGRPHGDPDGLPRAAARISGSAHIEAGRLHPGRGFRQERLNVSTTRHVIVTGGSRGLGAAMIEGLLADGYRVSTCSRSKSENIERLLAHPDYGRRFFWGSCQVGEAEQVDAFVRSTVAWAGDDGLYGLVNNAGIAQAGILASFPNVESEKILKINLLGAIQMARAAADHLLKQRGGRIINISSIIGSRGYNGLAAYSASKAGMDGLTRALARELGRRQITVNSVAPGYVKTEMSS